jgi:hypothetical protein
MLARHPLAEPTFTPVENRNRPPFAIQTWPFQLRRMAFSKQCCCKTTVRGAVLAILNREIANE